MAIPKSTSELCAPAYIYFILSMIGLILTMYQNARNSKVYSLGVLHIPVPHVSLVFIMKIIYVFFWTYLLNLICKDGHKTLSWFLILVPFILLFTIMVSSGNIVETFFINA